MRFYSAESTNVAMVNCKRARVDKNLITYAPEPGNECLLFHGTTRSCRLVENPKTVKLCKLETCSLCKIVRHSFEVDRSGGFDT
jgi:hypothetical protein